MQYNTALEFFLSGIGLFSLQFNFRRILIVVGILITLLGFLTLLQYIFNIQLGIDQLFMDHYITRKGCQVIELHRFETSHKYILVIAYTTINAIKSQKPYSDDQV